jgi:hypothetical protein
MKKDITICFRTSDELRKGLDEVALESRRSLSSIIENALTSFLKQRGVSGSGQDKRRHPRKAVCLPAFISAEGSEEPCPSIILDISLSGLKISLPKEFGIEVQEEGEQTHLNILFTLPQERTPVAMSCRASRILGGGPDIEVGAMFAECDFTNYQKLQNYLLQ